MHNIYLDFPDNNFLSLIPDNSNLKKMYDSFMNPSLIQYNQLIYVSKKNQFIKNHNKKDSEIIPARGSSIIDQISNVCSC